MEKSRIIEINGVKMEVDLRSAKKVDQFRVGDYVKVLHKEYSSYDTFPGVIVGFEQFEKLPTIIIAAVNPRSSTAELKFYHFNAQTTDTEIIKAEEEDLSFDREKIIDMFNREILKKEIEVQALKDKLAYFVRHFTKYVEVTTKKKKGFFKK